MAFWMIAAMRLALFAHERHARATNEFRTVAGHLVGELDVLHKLDMRVEVQHRHEPAIKRDCLFDLPLAGKPVEGDGLVREAVGHARYPADGTEEHVFERQVVDAAEHLVAIAEVVEHVGHAAAVVARFLDRDDVPFAGEFGEVGRTQVDLVGHAVVVDHDRQVDAARHRAEMLDRLARILLVDHARQYHQAACSCGLHAAGAFERTLAGIFGNAGNHRHATAGRFHRSSDDLLLLVQRQRAVLAERTEHDEAFAAGVEAALDMTGRGRQIERAVLLHFGHQSGNDTLPIRRHVQFSWVRFNHCPVAGRIPGVSRRDRPGRSRRPRATWRLRSAFGSARLRAHSRNRQA